MTEPTATTEGLLIEIPQPSAERLLFPGFIDLQINGGWGHDFTADPGSIWDVGAMLPRTGVTSFLPTIVSAPYQVVEAAIDALAAGPPNGYRGASPLGLHVEGPWISSGWRGAHDPGHLRLPDSGVARRWAESGLVRMVTIAPELEDAFEVAQVLSDHGVTVSAGHSGADFEVASRALAGPWAAVTHLFNQMTPFHHRDPGMVGAALLSDRSCGLIVDGIHSDPAAVRLAWEVVGADRLLLVTDAIQATGLGEGIYQLGDQEVTVESTGPRVNPETLAGSTLTMDRALSNLTAWSGAPVGDAVLTATRNPAQLIGAGDRGSLQVGLRADLVELDQNLEVLRTVVAGDTVYEAGQ